MCNWMLRNTIWNEIAPHLASGAEPANEEAAHYGSDNELVDLFLHAQDHPFDVPGGATGRVGLGAARREPPRGPRHTPNDTYRTYARV